MNKRYRPDYYHDNNEYNSLYSEPPPPLNQGWYPDIHHSEVRRFVPPHSQSNVDNDYLKNWEDELKKRESNFNKMKKEHLTYLKNWEKHILKIQNISFPEISYKTHLCRHGNNCKYISTCGFAHNKDELKLQYKLFWCPYGKECKKYRCTYVHSETEWLKYNKYEMFTEKVSTDIKQDTSENNKFEQILRNLLNPSTNHEVDNIPKNSVVNSILGPK